MKRVLAALMRTPAWVGALAALAHPPFNFPPGLLAFGALMLLADRATGLRSAFWRGWLAGLSYFAIGCYWVGEAFLVDAKTFGWMAPIAVAALAGGLALFWGLGLMLYRWASQWAKAGATRVLIFAGALATMEWVRGHIFTGFPWNLPGTAWAAGGAVSQFAGVVGAYGLTWITLAIMAGIVLLLEDWRSKPNRIAAGLAVASLLMITAYGALMLSVTHAEKIAPFRVRIVQPNLPQLAEYDAAASQSIARTYIQMTQAPRARPGPLLVIWPEGALPDTALIEPDDDLDLSRKGFLAPGHPIRAAIEQALQPGDILLIGGVKVTRQAPEVRYYNSLIALQRTPEGLKTLGVYDKHRLVPFGEYLPFAPLMHAIGFQQLVPISDGFSSGPPSQPLVIGDLTIQPLICYEALFPGFTGKGSRAAHRRADAIINVSTDAWFGQTSGPLQHLNQAAYRAIEEGLPEMRATPTGVSAVIDSRGRTIEAKQLGVVGLVDANLPQVIRPTIYSKLGEALFVVMLAVSCLICLYPMVFLAKKT
jgi:apolipoprotein N-acyltransferase